MKILVSIPDFRANQMQYLNAVLDEYRSYKKYDVTINVHSTVDIPRTDINLIKYDPTKVKRLAYVHRQEFFDNQNNYDLFIFSENDILVKEEAIDTFLKYDTQLPVDHSVGFIRYEQRVLDDPSDLKLYLIDVWPPVGHIVAKEIIVNGNSYFILTNRFQSCFVLTQNKLKHAIANSSFLRTDWEGIETAAAGVYRGWTHADGVINKVYPRNLGDVKKCLVHHLPDRHVNRSHPMNPTDKNPFWQSDVIGIKFCGKISTWDSLVNDLGLK